VKVKKHHLYLAVLAVAAAISWSVWPPAKGPIGLRARQAGTGAPAFWAGSQPVDPAQSSPRGVDPAGIPAPPSVEGASVSASARDPFLFGGESRDITDAAVPAGADPVVRSILISPGRRLALIQNRIVGVGGQVGDFRIVEIDRDAVIVTTAAGERRRVPLRAQASAGPGR
jgi:hypothetical protein